MVEVIGSGNTLAYYDTATITAVKSFIVQARDGTGPEAIFLVMFDPSVNEL
jgi:hypothetical protein